MICFDEVDSLAFKKCSISVVRSRVVSQLLHEMDGFNNGEEGG